MKDEQKRYCPECCTETLQTLELSDPDDEYSFDVWVCSVCKEEVDLQDKESTENKN